MKKTLRLIGSLALLMLVGFSASAQISSDGKYEFQNGATHKHYMTYTTDALSAGLKEAGVQTEFVVKAVTGGYNILTPDEAYYLTSTGAAPTLTAVGDATNTEDKYVFTFDVHPSNNGSWAITITGIRGL